MSRLVIQVKNLKQQQGHSRYSINLDIINFIIVTCQNYMCFISLGQDFSIPEDYKICFV